MIPLVRTSHITCKQWEIPLLFSGDKTLLRRPVKPQPDQQGFVEAPFVACDDCGNTYTKRARKCSCGCECMKVKQVRVNPHQCPYGCPTARVQVHLWVKETFDLCNQYGARVDIDHAATRPHKRSVIYKASPPYRYRRDAAPDDPDGQYGEPLFISWRPSTHMPQWASRLTLEIAEVRVERLQDITEDNAVKEGFPFGCDAVQWFKEQWNEDNPKYPWDSNPWVWVLAIRRIQGSTS